MDALLERTGERVKTRNASRAENRMPQVLAISSAGGHWVQMRRLMPAFDGMEMHFASVFPAYQEDVPDHKYSTIGNFSRADIWQSGAVAMQIFALLRRVRPDVVITTGAAPGLLAIAIAKTVFRTRTIWIDSIANCEQMSTSGKHARRFADVWLTQWPHLAGEDGPACWGAVL